MTLALALVFQSWQYNGLTDKNVPQSCVNTAITLASFALFPHLEI